MVEAAGNWFHDIVGAISGSEDEGDFRLVRDVFTLESKQASRLLGPSRPKPAWG